MLLFRCCVCNCFEVGCFVFKFVHIGWVSDSDGDLRCYPADCNLFPTAEECGGNNDDNDEDQG